MAADARRCTPSALARTDAVRQGEIGLLVAGLVLGALAGLLEPAGSTWAPA